MGGRVLTVTTLAAVIILSTSCGSPPKNEACATIAPGVLASAVGGPVRVIEGVTPDPPGDQRGCYYSTPGKPGAVEVWVLKKGGASWYDEQARSEAALRQDNFEDVSGPGFRAYQTAYDTTVLAHGVYVDVQLTLPADLGQIATLPAPQETQTLGRLRTAILRALGK